MIPIIYTGLQSHIYKALGSIHVHNESDDGQDFAYASSYFFSMTAGVILACAVVRRGTLLLVPPYFSFEISCLPSVCFYLTLCAELHLEVPSN